jgi:hypothetical protein
VFARGEDDFILHNPLEGALLALKSPGIERMYYKPNLLLGGHRMTARYLPAVAAFALMTSPAMAASALSEDILLILNPSLPDGVFIDEDRTTAFPLFCDPSVGTGSCTGPVIQNNLSPGLNFGGSYELRWTGQTAESIAPAPDFSQHDAFQQTIYAFGDVDPTVGGVFSIPWHMTYKLDTSGTKSTAAITLGIRENIAGGPIILPDTVLFQNSVSDGGFAADEVAGTFLLVIIAGAVTNLSVFDPEFSLASVPEPSSVTTMLIGLMILGIAKGVDRRHRKSRAQTDMAHVSQLHGSRS